MDNDYILYYTNGTWHVKFDNSVVYTYIDGEWIKSN